MKHCMTEKLAVVKVRPWCIATLGPYTKHTFNFWRLIIINMNSEAGASVKLMDTEYEPHLPSTSILLILPTDW